MAKKKSNKVKDLRNKTIGFDLNDENERQAYIFYEKIRYYQTKFITAITMEFINNYNITPSTSYEELKLIINYYISQKKVPDLLYKKNDSVPQQETYPANNEIELLRKLVDLQSVLLGQSQLINSNVSTQTINPMPESISRKENLPKENDLSNEAKEVVQIEQLLETPKETIKTEIGIQEEQVKPYVDTESNFVSSLNKSSYEKEILEDDEDDDDDDSDDHAMIRSMLNGFSGMLK